MRPRHAAGRLRPRRKRRAHARARGTSMSLALLFPSSSFGLLAGTRPFRVPGVDSVGRSHIVRHVLSHGGGGARRAGRCGGWPLARGLPEGASLLGTRSPRGDVAEAPPSTSLVITRSGIAPVSDLGISRPLFCCSGPYTRSSRTRAAFITSKPERCTAATLAMLKLVKLRGRRRRGPSECTAGSSRNRGASRRDLRVPGRGQPAHGHHH